MTFSFVGRLSLVAFISILAPSLAWAQSGGDFGSKRRLAFALHGRIYNLPDTTTVLPDFSKLEPIGEIFTTRLNVPPREFTDGFPGVTERFEWFGMEYTGEFTITEGGNYQFSLLSDDGARLYIDEELVIDNDGLHGPAELTGGIALRPGRHTIRVPYFQGPRYEVALVLQMALNDGPFEVFDIERFSTVQTDRSDGKTRFTLGASTLFDLDKADLKPAADSTLLQIAAFFKDSPPTSRMVIEGHTDDLGSDAHNQDLSERRAAAVAAWMKAHGVPESRFITKGYGEKSPRYPNTSEKNRAGNRRVEITIEE